MGTDEIRDYLTHLAVEKKSRLRRKRSPSTRFCFFTNKFYGLNCRPLKAFSAPKARLMPENLFRAQNLEQFSGK
jgi:hypothetical protein